MMIELICFRDYAHEPLTGISYARCIDFTDSFQGFQDRIFKIVLVSSSAVLFQIKYVMYLNYSFFGHETSTLHNGF